MINYTIKKEFLLPLYFLFIIINLYINIDRKFDFDLDTLSNITEISTHTNVYINDTNNDGISDNFDSFISQKSSSIYSYDYLDTEFINTNYIDTDYIIHDSGFRSDIDGICFPNKSYNNIFLKNGVCFGYSLVSTLIYTNSLPLKINSMIFDYTLNTNIYNNPLYQNKDTIYNNDFKNALIYYYFKQCDKIWFFNNFNIMKNKIKDMENIIYNIDKGIPTVLCLEKEYNKELIGHSLVVYSIKEYKNKYELSVYDNNFPGNKFIYNDKNINNDISDCLKIDIYITGNPLNPYIFNYSPFQNIINSDNNYAKKYMLDSDSEETNYKFSSYDKGFCFYYSKDIIVP